MRVNFVETLVLLFIVTAVAKEENNQAVVREIWDQVRGDSIQNLLADVRFPHKPSKVAFLSTFDTPTNDGAHFAQRLKGYFIAPKTGEYKFYSSCDDECEVFLGLDGKEGENNRIISQKKSSMHNEFDRFPDQVSHSLFLEKGKSYYLEEIGRQSTGRENLSLGVELPNGKRYFPIPNKFLSKYTTKSSIHSAKLKSRKAKKRQGKETETTEMKEGSLGKLLVSANGEKKSMKSEDYPDVNRMYPENNAQAVLEVDGAEIEQPENSDGAKEVTKEGMFANKENSQKGMEEFELNPRLEVTSDIANGGLLNEAGIEKAVEEALKQRNDKQETRDNEVAFANTDKKEGSDSLEGHGTEVAKPHSNEVVEQEQVPASTGKGNDTVLEMNKASEAGQIAMNLVNVSNFKVVIPGGKTYQISGSPGSKPLVTVVPSMENGTVAAQKDAIKNDTTAALKDNEVKTEASPANKKESAPPGESTVTAVQHGNVVDVHVNKDVMEMPKLVPTSMDQSLVPMSGAPIMGVPHLEHPQVVQPHPVLDSSVASLMYHPEPPMIEHPMAHLPEVQPIVDHQEHHDDHMHIEVSSTPVHEAPKPQKVDPEVIKVEFLPEGISVDTASAKISKKCKNGAEKKSTDPEDCKEEGSENAKPTAKSDTTKVNAEKEADLVAKSTSTVNSKVVAALDAKMFVAPPAIKGLPGDVTVVPAERQGAMARVLVQDMTSEKNETKMNTVNMSPAVKTSESSPFPTITGSVMNNVTGKPVPFEVKVVSNQQEAQELAGGKGTNFTISADSRTFASGVATGTNKKGQQQTIIILPDALKKHETDASKTKPAEDRAQQPQPQPQYQPEQTQQQPSAKKPAAEKTFPVTMDNVSGGGGGGAQGEFVFPDMSTLNPGSDPSVVSASSPGFAGPNMNQNNQMPEIVPTNMAMNQQQPNVPQQQQAGQDRVLIGPPDNIYHGPILSPVASSFMSDLNKGSFSTEEALDLMNNYVSGSQDMTSSIKKLAGVLQKVDARGKTPPVQQENKLPSPPQQKFNGMLMKGMGQPETPNSFNMPPMSRPQMMNTQGMRGPSGGEIAALLAIGPNRNFGQSEMDGRNMYQNNIEEEPREGSRDLYNRHTYPERQGDSYEPNAFQEQPNAFMGGHSDNDAAMRRVNQLGHDKPPPVHLFQNFDARALARLPGGDTNMMREEGMNNGGGPMEDMPPQMRENNFSPFMNSPMQNGNLMQNSNQMPDFSSVRNTVDSFLNRIDPHEISPNPSVAMPENGLARHTLSKRPQQNEQGMHSEGQERGAFYRSGPSNAYPGRSDTANEESMGYQNVGQKHAPVAGLHGNGGNTISDMYTDSLFPEDIADIESLRGSLQGKTLSAYDRQEEAQTQGHPQGRSETHPNKEKQLRVSFPLKAVTKESRFKGALRSHIAQHRRKASTRKNGMLKRGKQQWKKTQDKLGAKRSFLLRRAKKHRKQRRDLVSIMPKHHGSPKKSKDEDDIVLNVDEAAKAEPAKTEPVKEQLSSYVKEATANTKDTMTLSKRPNYDSDKAHLKSIAVELKAILGQLHHNKKTSFDIWEGNKATEKSTTSNRIGSDYEIQYVKGKVSDEDIVNRDLSSYQSPDAERFQQDVWEPGSRGEGTMLGALVNYKRGILPKVEKKSPRTNNAKSKIPSKHESYKPYFKDWKLDEEIRLLQRL